MRYASPPVNPPADTRIECSECDGRGVHVYGDDCELSADCTVCDGEGLVEYDPDDDPSAPDYWKDAL